MRIQLFCAAFPPFGKGGGPATSELIARALAQAGHEVEVVTASDRPHEDNSKPYRVISMGSPNIYADYWQPRPSWKKMIWHIAENFNPVAYVRARKALRRFKPDVVATISIENVNVATWLAARKQGVPIAHFLHSYFVICWRGSLYKDDKLCVSRCGSCRKLSVGKEAMAKYVDAVVGESRFITQRHVEEGVFADIPALTVPSPMTDAPEPVKPEPRTQTRNPWLTVGFLGNVAPEKGVFTLAAAARRLRESHGLNVRFKLGGTGRESVMEELRKAFPEDSVEFLGWCKAPDVYNSVDVVVVPSQWNEPFGRVSIEPLEYALPVIVARSGGLPENVEDGVSGRVFTPGDDAELARILAELVDDPAVYARLSRGAAERADLYSFPRFVDAIDRTMREVAAMEPGKRLKAKTAA